MYTKYECKLSNYRLKSIQLIYPSLKILYRIIVYAVCSLLGTNTRLMYSYCCLCILIVYCSSTYSYRCLYILIVVYVFL